MEAIANLDIDKPLKERRADDIQTASLLQRIGEPHHLAGAGARVVQRVEEQTQLHKVTVGY